MTIDKINPISSCNGQGTKAITATVTLDPWKEPEAESKI
jgi:hypothetical protein